MLIFARVCYLDCPAIPSEILISRQWNKQKSSASRDRHELRSVRISVTVWDRSMIFFFVSKVSTRPNYFEGQGQGQGHAKVTSDRKAKKWLKQSFFIAIRPNLKYTFPQTSVALP